jgi:hypothetical protein
MSTIYNRKKSSILINPKFQWTLIGYASAVAVLILIAVYGLFSFGFHEFTLIGAQAGLPADHVYFQFIKMQEGTFHRVLLVLALVVALILVVGGLVVSHKIAGPVYRMKKEFTEMQNKTPVELKKIHFRKGDFFPELADTYNQLIDKLKGQG